MNPNNTPTSLMTRVRDELAVRRERRDASKALRRDLATYSTPDEIHDLLAAIGPDESADAEEVRTILVQNLARLAS
jgi:hypothetical protein